MSRHPFVVRQTTRRTSCELGPIRAKARVRPTGFYFPFNTKPALEVSLESREKQYEEAWAGGGLPFLGSYGDLLFEKPPMTPSPTSPAGRSAAS
jgi:hypothetical protein